MNARIPGMAAASTIGSPRMAVVTRVVALLTSFIHSVSVDPVDYDGGPGESF